jgi:hypothetical protein
MSGYVLSPRAKADLDASGITQKETGARSRQKPIFGSLAPPSKPLRPHLHAEKLAITFGKAIGNIQRDRTSYFFVLQTGESTSFASFTGAWISTAILADRSAATIRAHVAAQQRAAVLRIASETLGPIEARNSASCCFRAPPERCSRTIG